MPAVFFRTRRALHCAVLGVALPWSAVWANTAAPAHVEARPHPTEPAKRAAAAAPAPTSVAKGAADAAPAATPVQEARDPLDIVRERLAAKLGAVKAPDTPNPNVVRVIAKASPGAAGHAAEPAPGGRARAAAARAAGPAATLAEPVHMLAAHWDYSGAGGPDSWGRMKPEFATCSGGTRQSPIDIRDGIKVNLDPVQFDYRPSGFRVLDNGHTIQVNVGAGNSIQVMGRRFDLVQFHFHRPSEERIDGKQFDMVAHLVHKDLEGRLAVVAVLLDRGSAQPTVQSVWDNLPLEKGQELAAPRPIDLNSLLPADRSYFTYMGSLTTPPCSEGVLWMVLKQPVPIAPEQINVFARIYPMNARPIQSASGRMIKESN